MRREKRNTKNNNLWNNNIRNSNNSNIRVIRVIIEKTPKSAAENMARDAALQQHCTMPTLRLYTWYPAAVSIGRFQSLQDEVDTEQCKKYNVDIVRRVTGGGAVFHEHEITYSLCIPETNDYFSSDLHESYEFICAAVIKGFAQLGLSAHYVPINDLLVNGRKISGCAQTRKNKIILHHGTILLEVNVEKMFQLLKVPNEKIRDKLITDVKQRVTSVEIELQQKMPVQQVMAAMVAGFEQQFHATAEMSAFSEQEKQTAAKIKKGVFSNRSWNYER